MKKTIRKKDAGRPFLFSSFLFLFLSLMVGCFFMREREREKKKRKRKGAQDLKYWPAACFVMAGQ